MTTAATTERLTAKRRARKTALPEEISSSDLARLLGLSAGRISQLQTQGVIERTERGRYALEASVGGYAELLRSGSHQTASVASLTSNRSDKERQAARKLKLA